MKAARAVSSAIAFGSRVAGAFTVVVAAWVFAASAGSIVPGYRVLKAKNGVEIWIFPAAKVPIFDLELVYQGGALEDPDGKAGTANLFASLLNHGGGWRSEKEVLSLLDRLSGGVSYAADHDEFIASAYGLDSEHRAIIDFLFDGLERPKAESGIQPKTAEDILDRLRKNMLDSIQRVSDSPATLAAHAADLIADDGTVYARPLAGGPNDLRRITLEDLSLARSRLLRTDRLKVLLIAGKDRSDPDLKRITEYVRTKVEGLSCPACGNPVAGGRRYSWPALSLKPGAIAVIRKDGFSETHVYKVGRGVKRQVPEYYDLLVAEAILGGTFSSRLVSILREKMNLTYSVSADFEFMRETGAIKISASTRKEDLGALLRTLNDELARFASRGAAKEEVARAKDYLIGSFPLGLENSFLVAERFFRSLLDGLPRTVLDDFPRRVRATSAKSVNAAIAKYLHPSDFITVISGDSEQIRRQLSGFDGETVDLKSDDVIGSY